MRTIGLAYKWVNVRCQVRDLTGNPASLILSLFGILSIAGVAFLFGYSARVPEWGHDVAPSLLRTEQGLSLLLLAYCGFFGVVLFALTLVALFSPSQVQELERLRALPIPESLLFSFKCGDILHSLSPLVFLVVLSAAAGMNVGGQAGAGFLAVLLVLSVLLVYVVGWTMLCLVLLFVNLLPRRAFGRGALLAGIVAAGTVGLAALRAIDRRQLLAGLSGFAPTRWTAGLILSAEQGEWRGAAVSGVGVLAFALALRTVAFLAYRSLYLRRLTPLLEKVGPDPRAGAEEGGWIEAALLAPLAWASPATRALARKDLRWIRRDPVVGYAAYCAVALVFLGAGIAWWEAQTGEGEALAYPMGGVVALILLGHLLNLNLSSFGREELGLETIRAIPLAPRQLLAAKSYVSFVLSLPVVAVVLGLARIVGGGRPLASWAEAAAVGVSCAAAFAWISATLGAVFPKYDARNQFRAVTLVGVGVHAGLLALLVASLAGAIFAVHLYGQAFLFVPALVALVWAAVLSFLTTEARRALCALLGTR